MMLYVNGCSHSAAAEAANCYAWSCDDGNLWGSGTEPHPANLAVSYGKHVADGLSAELICQASSGGSNDRIIRTTWDWINANQHQLADTFIILQWTTWEREEWWHGDRFWQVNASGVDTVPLELSERYKNYVTTVDWNIKTQQAHDQIWAMHCQLKQLGIRHLFFSGHSTFSDIYHRRDWGANYIEPYSRAHSYNAVLINNNFEYANPKSFHFGADAHCFWGKYLLQYIDNNELLKHHEISTD